MLSKSLMSTPFSDTQAADTLAVARLRVVIATIVLNVIAVAVLTLASWSDWRTGLGLNILDNALLLGFVIMACPRFLIHSL